MARHMIRLNEQNRIIKAFSTDFENSEEGDICVEEEGGRHFHLDIVDSYTGAFKKAWDSVNSQIVDVDLSAEIAARDIVVAETAALEAKRQRRLFGEKVIDKIAVLNDTKSLTVEQVLGFMSNAEVKSIDALLRSGSIESAKAMITGLDFEILALSIWTESDRTVILNMINASGYVTV